MQTDSSYSHKLFPFPGNGIGEGGITRRLVEGGNHGSLHMIFLSSVTVNLDGRDLQGCEFFPLSAHATAKAKLFLAFRFSIT
jgi:hypothetical protein